jgi:hypothetical protein
MTRGGWAAARVNMFLRMMSGGKVKDSYRKADQDIAKASEIDVTGSWEPNDSDFSEANNDIQEYNLDYDFEDENDLYLDTEQEKANWLEYI